VGDLNIDEIKEVYDIEAVSYDRKHHLTTRGMDTVWRRMAGWCATTVGRNNNRALNVLDLCTGTGLMIKEMISIFKEWGITGNIIGLDYNLNMLSLAKSQSIFSDDIKLSFVRGNAMDLVVNNRSPKDDLIRFEPNTFDVVTQMCGIGGIIEPLKNFEDVLQILKPGGWYFVSDMHRPIPEQPGEWPFLLKWCRFPLFEAVTYEQTTIPLALNRLWGWRDTTLDFYLLPLTTWKDDEDKNWGFKVISFNQESQRWWFGLPIMPIGKIIVEKVEITSELAKTRRIILKACSFK